ncbi:DUF748 domain-containing protein [Maribacter hydrothermalis]|uniref:DUF748 domain-containing protein n=1 Tax=Maribacter hydrothermalis TaxID=1836467 RepID=A0A1B7Z225_9FLAO|nr:DUF748 domain-containing protein [Maribacter hydrothermalis]APQ19349.1 hypothetical protein BTR34_12850 [Maribacter hydrothermalis]OBR36744.1 hypothetical protein A9200_08740 [Maribacter hydrothermalis]
MKVKTKKAGIRKKRFVFPILIIVFLLVARLLLPYVVKNYVNGVLADIPGYYGEVGDIDLSVFRGAYVIKNLFLNKKDAGSEVPFIAIERTDISVAWKALFNGKVVSEIEMIRPQIIYVFEDQQQNKIEDTDIEDWSKALTDLVPIEINNLKITNGKAAFVQLNAAPNIDLNLNNINLEALNLRNVVRVEKELPSSLSATATSIGNGNVKLEGKMDLVKEIPDMDISFSLEHANIVSFNDFTNHYAGIDFSSGEFNLYSEVAIANGFLTGYLKPLLKDSKLISKEDKFFEKLWEGFVGFFKFVLKNQKNNTLATKVPIEGDLNKVEGKIWTTIFNVFKNAWIAAYTGTVDDEVEYEDAEKRSEKNNKK